MTRRRRPIIGKRYPLRTVYDAARAVRPDGRADAKRWRRPPGPKTARSDLGGASRLPFGNAPLPPDAHIGPFTVRMLPLMRIHQCWSRDQLWPAPSAGSTRTLCDASSATPERVEEAVQALQSGLGA